MLLSLAILSYQDLKHREISRQFLFLVFLFRLVGLDLTLFLTVTGLFSLFLLPFYHFKVIGLGDLAVQYLILLEYFQGFPGLIFLFLLFNFWFIAHTHLTKRSLPYIPIVSALTSVALFLPKGLLG